MITVQIASIPSREEMLEKTIGSLCHQCDTFRIMLNGHRHPPDYLYDYSNIEYHLLNNELGDAAKFYPGYQDGYVFTCDDDLIYPPDYIETMMDAIDKFNCIISLHGRKMKPRPITNSYTSRTEAYHCLHDVNGHHIVDIAGTGVMGFHTDRFVPSISRMKFKNMADIWIAKQAFDKNITLMVIPHQEGWLKYQNPTNTIWDRRASTVKLQTAVYNSIGKATDY